MDLLWNFCVVVFSVIWFNQMIQGFRDPDTEPDENTPAQILNSDLESMFDRTQRQIR